jgi:hypothetical protein
MHGGTEVSPCKGCMIIVGTKYLFNAFDNNCYYYVLSKAAEENGNVNDTGYLGKVKSRKCIILFFLTQCSEFIQWNLVKR